MVYAYHEISFRNDKECLTDICKVLSVVLNKMLISEYCILMIQLYVIIGIVAVRYKEWKLEGGRLIK